MGEIPKDRWFFFEENLWKILWNSVITSSPANLNIFGMSDWQRMDLKWYRIQNDDFKQKSHAFRDQKPGGFMLLMWKNAASWLREAARLMGAGKETSKETALEAVFGLDGFQSQQLHMMTKNRVNSSDIFRYWLFIQFYTYTWVGWWCWCLTVSMLIVIWCYMIYRIARYFDQLGFWELLPVWRWNYFWPVWCWCGSPECGKEEFSLRQSCLTLDFEATRFSAMAWLFQIPYHILCLLFFSWEISEKYSFIFYFRPFFGRWMTLVAASLISTRTKLWLIADASLGVFLFFSHFSPGRTDISAVTASVCSLTKTIFMMLPVATACLNTRTAGATKKPSPSLRPSIRRQRLAGGQRKGRCTRQNIRKDVEDREQTHVFPRKRWFRWCTLWWSLT